MLTRSRCQLLGGLLAGLALLFISAPHLNRVAAAKMPAQIPVRINEADLKNLNPAAITITMPSQIKWTPNPATPGLLTSYLYGAGDKPGLYVVLVKWLPHSMTHPHFHPNDRYVTVLSGTWWVGTGTKYDPDHTVPLPAGSYSVHHGMQVHYDGAKDEGCVLEIVGMGPASPKDVPETK